MKLSIKRVILYVLSATVLLLSFDSQAIRTVTYLNKPYVYLRDVAKELGMTIASGKESCSLKSRYGTMTFHIDKKLAIINGVDVSLSFPSGIKDGVPVISRKDYELMILPIFRTNFLKRQYVRTIIIDPGHGGKDNGTKGAYSKEKDIALTISRKVASYLQKSGYKVVMTRNSDKYIPLESRTEVVSRYKGDIFISIHCNSAKSSISGYETFILAPQGTSSTYSDKAGYNSEPGNTYDCNNARLGYEIQKALGATGRTDRDLKHARFSVLKNATKPAALVETGFLSNRYEEKLLNSPAYQDKLAKAIAGGIIAYCNAAAKGK